MILAPGTKHQRKNIKNKLATGKIPLRVIGTSVHGFRLAGQVGDKVIPVGQTYPKQNSAVQVGYEKYGTKATKVVGLSPSTFAGNLNSSFGGDIKQPTGTRNGVGVLTTIGA